ncbi:sialate O-acetylesterase [Flexithrix dorotheae]|uniref:sialate O-acetylesterase n=1 Tax=Flexithrix dorotheae TaxID=70993 RepID=UPI000376E9C7|nr:sialate O-acetylesterase [Flexithrix dorotheae]
MRNNYLWAIPLLVLFCFFSACNQSVNQKEQKAEVSKEDFHIYILIGQSNMAGRGKPGKLDTIPHERVFMLNKNNEWELAKDPMHFDKPVAGVGPGLTFGKMMATLNPQVNIGLVPCAAGGSPIDSWTPGGFHEQTKSYPYDDAIKRIEEASKKGVIKGFLWHQGESDSKEEKVGSYKMKLAELVGRMRTAGGNEKIPFVVGGLGDFFVQKNAFAAEINSTLETFAKENENVGFVSAKNLTHKGDDTHFSSASARELGKRYAEVMMDLQQ